MRNESFLSAPPPLHRHPGDLVRRSLGEGGKPGSIVLNRSRKIALVFKNSLIFRYNKLLRGAYTYDIRTKICNKNIGNINGH